MVLRSEEFTTDAPSRPRLTLLFGSFVLALVGLVIGLLTRSLLLNVVGWLIGGVVALVLFGSWQIAESRRQRQGLVYSYSWTVPLQWGTAVVVVAALALNAWRIADVVSRW